MEVFYGNPSANDPQSLLPVSDAPTPMASFGRLRPGQQVEILDSCDTHTLYLDTTVKSGPDRLRFVNHPKLTQQISKHWPEKEALASFLESKNENQYARRVRECAKFMRVEFDADMNNSRIVDGVFCDCYRMCPVCGHRKSMERFAQVMPDVLCLLHQPSADLILALLTVTVKNGHNLRERLKHLTLALSRAHNKMKHAHGRGSVSEFGRIRGAHWSVECTYDSKTGWHPHAHAIVLMRTTDVFTWVEDKQDPSWRYPYPFDVKELRREWQEITGDSCVVHSRPFDVSRELVNDPECRSRIGGLADKVGKGLLEGLKYAVKFEVGNYDERWAVQEATFRKHLCRRWGNLREVEPCALAKRVRGSWPFTGLFRHTGEEYKLIGLQGTERKHVGGH